MTKEQIYERLEKILEDEGWRIVNDTIEQQDKEYYIEIETYSPEGQDVVQTIWAKKIDWESWVQGFENCAEGYDADEEASLWYGKNNGEPSSLRDLLDDMEWVQEQLNRLCYVIQGKTPPQDETEELNDGELEFIKNILTLDLEMYDVNDKSTEDDRLMLHDIIVKIEGLLRRS